MQVDPGDVLMLNCAALPLLTALALHVTTVDSHGDRKDFDVVAGLRQNVHRASAASTTLERICILNISGHRAEVDLIVIDPMTRVKCAWHYAMPTDSELRHEHFKSPDFFVVNRIANREFPHKCPRCAAPAYLGAFEVTHADEAAASGCPARRK